MDEILEELKFNKQVSIYKSDVTVVIPTLNEEEAIEFVLRGIMSEGYSNILVVDGNSYDETVSIAGKLKVRVITQKGHGKTGAIVTAISQVKTPYFVVIDGDFTYSPSDIEYLIEKASQYNQVIGARKDRSNIKLFNRLGNRMINVLFNLYFGSNLNDVCSGLYLINTSFAKELVLESGGFDVEVEIAAQSALKKTVIEVPISYGKRIGIQKLNPIKDGFRIGVTINKLGAKHRTPFFFSLITVGGLVIAGGLYLLIGYM